MSRFLTRNPTGITFLEIMGTPTGRRASFGDVEALPAAVRPDVTVLDIEMRDAIDKLTRLAQDKSRLGPEKHFIAKGLADKLLVRIDNTKKSIAREADHMVNDAVKTASNHFAPSLNYGALHSEIRAWAREQLKLPDGVGFTNIKDALKDPQIASAIYHTNHRLLNLDQGVHVSLGHRAMELHLPEAWQQAQEGLKLGDLPPRYDRAAQQVRGAFYEQHEVEAYATRVDVAV